MSDIGKAFIAALEAEMAAADQARADAENRLFYGRGAAGVSDTYAGISLTFAPPVVVRAITRDDIQRAIDDLRARVQSGEYDEECRARFARGLVGRFGARVKGITP